MNYEKIFTHWLPYGLMKDKRGFISRRFDGGHTGVDSVGNEYANPVCAVISGTVTASYYSNTLGHVVEYESGAVRVAHYHLAQRAVGVGATVIAGATKIGTEGSTGSLSSGKHLHTSTWINGELTDPELFLCGEQKFPEEAEKGDENMARKVIQSGLNLRTGAGTVNPSYGYIKVGSLLNPTETKVISGNVWGKTAAVLADGTVKNGWCNLGDTWSQHYTGAIASAEEWIGAEKKLKAVAEAIR